MSTSKYQTVYGTRVYPIEYLCNNELTESDLNNLLDNDKKGLLLSLIIGMFKTIKSNKRNFQIVKLLKTDKNWMYKNKWSQEQRDNYEKMVIDVYKNIYQYKDLQAISLGQWFMTIYGLSVEGNGINLEK